MEKQLQELLLKVARQSITSVFSGSQPFNSYALKEDYPELDEERATFVTLTLNGQLRGCIGSLQARQSLFDDVVSNAQAAAFRDPRFSKLTYDELEACVIEVSVLTPPEKVEFDTIETLRQCIVPHRDGVILVCGNHQATFLPQVWEQLEGFDAFFAHLAQKAGIVGDWMQQDLQIYTYQVEKFKER